MNLNSNFNNKCRTCLGIPKQPKDLFTDDNLLKKIKIEYISEFPTQICEECFRNINCFDNFRKVIIDTELKLQKIFENLKETTYSSRPRRKIKCETGGNNTSDLVISVKSEPDSLEKQFEFNDLGHSSDDSDADVKNALVVETDFKCQNCEKTFTSSLKLKNHRHTMHVPPGKCDICGKVVRSDHLRKHIKLHTDGPCVCEDCGKTFKNSESLRTHKFMHVEQAITCEICGKISKSKRSHGGHLREHKEQKKKVVCYLCGKRVRFLKKHILTHTGEKPFVCLYCNKKFTLQYNLKVHMRVHLNERPFNCEYCCISFTQKVRLKTHLKTKHEHETNFLALT